MLRKGDEPRERRFILRITTDDGVYQFGLNPWCRVEGHLPFHVELREAKLTYSKYSLLLRVVAVGLLAYFVWDRFGGPPSSTAARPRSRRPSASESLSR